MKAFPFANEAEKEYNWINRGMDLRDYFAAVALSGMMCAVGTNDEVNQKLAESAYRKADAMMKARE